MILTHFPFFPIVMLMVVTCIAKSWTTEPFSSVLEVSIDELGVEVFREILWNIALLLPVP